MDEGGSERLIAGHIDQWMLQLCLPHSRLGDRQVSCSLSDPHLVDRLPPKETLPPM